MCASTLLSFHQLYIICQSNNTRFLQSLEGEAYEHHVVKNQAVGDASELLELQSIDIENEILNMHGSKEINEAESEIAANAAVKELERIGSAENISLVEEVIDVIESPSNDVHPDSTDGSKKSAVKSEKVSNQNKQETEKKTRNKAKKEPIRRQTKTEEKTGKTKKSNGTAAAAAAAATTPAAKSRAIKSPKKSAKSPKTEILKENITRSKAERTAPTVPTNGKDVKENSCIDDNADDDFQM